VNLTALYLQLTRKLENLAAFYRDLMGFKGELNECFGGLTRK
jgi:hypothetical protein